MIDAARIREVLAPFVALANFYGSRDGKDVIYTQIEPCRKAAALFRDLDAQGAAPAGWPPREATEEMIAAGWIDKEDVSPREIWQSMWDAAPASPSPALHALDEQLFVDGMLSGEPTADAYCDDPHTERMAAIRRELTRAEPTADTGEVERACRAFVTARGLNPDTLHQANPGDEWDSFPADSEFTDYTGRKTKLVKGWRKWTEPMKAAMASLRPASSEEQVERAASENCPWLSPKRREAFIAGALFGARAILASAEAQPGARP